jgi:hypothetical protein
MNGDIQTLVVLKGHGLSRANRTEQLMWVLQAAEKHRSDAVLKGHGFIRADKPNGNGPALATEGSFSSQPDRSRSFSAATLTHEGWLFGSLTPLDEFFRSHFSP